ncbi:hypothetical protein A2767_01120 [Candidatus Roizmanbacteria bacterium RIFCSPHIGHO2_01_FULL_35_10]|nr:MAG: hypothetical protein A2767_01120 [Candidatus Roizmanbacteria bacterium RIFCSPHIGHO2_01_FULL_35_10]
MKSNAYIQHILEAIQAIEQFTKDVIYEEFLKNKEKHSAVVRQFEIIGEAINQLEKFLEEKNRSLKDVGVPFEAIIEMRNILIHEYFAVDLELVWDTIQKDLPDLKKQMKKLQKISY